MSNSSSNGRKKGGTPAGPAPSLHDETPYEPVPLPCIAIDALKAEKLRWLWPGRLALGTLAILEGAKGSGKSSIAAAIAADVSGGPRLIAGRKRALGPVLWFPGEEAPASMTVGKTTAAGCPKGKVQLPGYNLAGQLVHRLRLPGDLSGLSETIRQHKARLVVLDPWHSFLDCEVSLFDTQLMRSVMEALAVIADQTGALMLCTRNFRKDESGGILARGYGSGEISNVARSVLQTRPHPDAPDQLVLTVAVTNLGEPAKPLAYRLSGHKGSVRVEWGATLGASAEEVARADSDPGGRDERVDARTLLRKSLAPGWRAAKEILAEAQASGICPRTLRAAKAELGVPSRRVGDSASGHWEWGPPTRAS